MARILCVDDEPRVLDGLRLNLEMDYEVETAESGRGALALLEARTAFDVVVSDMRMPGMDGAQLLAEFSRRAPDTMRLLLTGHSDADAARRAVNEGGVFRYLQKPCSADHLIASIEEALEVRRARQLEHELLSTTLKGSVEMMSEVLAIAAPAVAARSRRVNVLVGRIGPSMGVPPGAQWELEVAALLSGLGAIAVPGDIVDRAAAGQSLSSTHEALIHAIPSHGASMVRRVPRLERAAEWIERSRPALPTGRQPDEADTLGVAMWAVQEVERGRSWPELVRVVRGALGDTVAHALGASFGVGERTVRALSAADLRVGMITCEDVKTRSGQLVVKADTELSRPFIIRLRNFAENVGLVEPFRVALPAP